MRHLALAIAAASALTVQTAAAAPGDVTITVPDPACMSPDEAGHPRICGDGPTFQCQEDAPGASFEAALVGAGYTQQFTITTDSEQLVILCRVSEG